MSSSKLKGEDMTEVKQPISNKLDSWLTLGYEKLAREYGLSIEDIKTATITIKSGIITIKETK